MHAYGASPQPVRTPPSLRAVGESARGARSEGPTSSVFGGATERIVYAFRTPRDARQLSADLEWRCGGAGPSSFTWMRTRPKPRRVRIRVHIDGSVSCLIDRVNLYWF